MLRTANLLCSRRTSGGCNICKRHLQTKTIHKLNINIFIDTMRQIRSQDVCLFESKFIVILRNKCATSVWAFPLHRCGNAAHTNRNCISLWSRSSTLTKSHTRTNTEPHMAVERRRGFQLNSISFMRAFGILFMHLWNIFGHVSIGVQWATAHNCINHIVWRISYVQFAQCNEEWRQYLRYLCAKIELLENSQRPLSAWIFSIRLLYMNLFVRRCAGHARASTRSALNSTAETTAGAW